MEETQTPITQRCYTEGNCEATSRIICRHMRVMKKRCWRRICGLDRAFVKWNLCELLPPPHLVPLIDSGRHSRSTAAPPPSVRRSWSGASGSLRTSCPTSGCSALVGSSSWSLRSASAALRVLGCLVPRRSYSAESWGQICVKSRRIVCYKGAAPVDPPVAAAVAGRPPPAPPEPSSSPRTSWASNPRLSPRSCLATAATQQRSCSCFCRSFWWSLRNVSPAPPAPPHLAHPPPPPPHLQIHPGWSLPVGSEETGRSSEAAGHHTLCCRTAGEEEEEEEEQEVRWTEEVERQMKRGDRS